MENELWLPVKGAEERYLVSNKGNVFSLPKNGNCGHLVTLRTNSKGYVYVHLYKDGKQWSPSVHKLVAEAFVANPHNLPQVNHKDENKQNNCVSNLEWCTCKYNINYGQRNKSVSKIVVEYAPAPIFDYLPINLFNSAEDAARIYGISANKIRECCTGKRKSYKGRLWKYKINVCGN